MAFGCIRPWLFDAVCVCLYNHRVAATINVRAPSVGAVDDVVVVGVVNYNDDDGGGGGGGGDQPAMSR